MEGPCKGLFITDKWSHKSNIITLVVPTDQLLSPVDFWPLVLLKAATAGEVCYYIVSTQIYGMNKNMVMPSPPELEGTSQWDSPFKIILRYLVFTWNQNFMITFFRGMTDRKFWNTT